MCFRLRPTACVHLLVFKSALDSIPQRHISPPEIGHNHQGDLEQAKKLFRKAKELGAIGYICKPWEPDEIEAQVKKVEFELG